MYATVPLGALVKALSFVVLIVFLGLFALLGIPDGIVEWGRRMSGTVVLAGLLVTLVFGSNSRWAPWRLLWRWIPKLNEWLFPDLNGTWEGSGHSNYSRVELVRDAAQTPSRAVNLGEIDQAELTPFDIALYIKATLFDLRITGKLGNTQSSSHSLSARVLRGPDDRFRLHYSYAQETRNVGVLDESIHHGAASLVVENCNERLTGIYWTRRMWQTGMNTAGTFDLRKTGLSRVEFDQIDLAGV